jgi:hypothetical protein
MFLCPSVYIFHWGFSWGCRVSQQFQLGVRLGSLLCEIQCKPEFLLWYLLSVVFVYWHSVWVSISSSWVSVLFLWLSKQCFIPQNGGRQWDFTIGTPYVILALFQIWRIDQFLSQTWFCILWNLRVQSWRSLLSLGLRRNYICSI